MLEPRGSRARHEPGVDRPGRGPRAVQRAVRRASSIPQPAGGTATTVDEALAVVDARRLPGAGAPVVRARRPRHGDRLRRRRACAGAMAELADDGSPRPRGRAVGRAPGADRPLPRGRDRGRRRRASATAPARCVIGGVMEHIEEAGVHSGDSACAIPPPTLSRRDDRACIEEHTRAHRRRARRASACSTCSTR